MHEKSKTINNIPNPDVPANKSLLGKRPHTEDQQKRFPNLQKASSFRNLHNTAPKIQHVTNQPTDPREDSSKYGKTLSPLRQKHVRESSTSSHEPPQLNKGKFSYENNREESGRESKLRKIDDFTNLPVMTSKPNFGDISPESSSNEPLSSPDLINVVNMKLTILPAEIVPYNQMYRPPSTAGNFDAEVLAFNPNFINNPSDFNIDAY